MDTDTYGINVRVLLIEYKDNFLANIPHFIVCFRLIYGWIVLIVGSILLILRQYILSIRGRFLTTFFGQLFVLSIVIAIIVVTIVQQSRVG